MDGVKIFLRGRTQHVVAVVGFLDLLAVALILPPLSSHLKSLGLASWQRGFVLSSYGVLQFVSGPVVGSVSDKGEKGDRRKVFLVCCLCTAFSYSLLGFSSSSIVWALSARAIAGVFKHSQTLSKALICDAISGTSGDSTSGSSTSSSSTSGTSGASRSAALARFNGVSSVGFIVGPVIGGHLLQAYPNYGFAICCQLAALLFLGNALITQFCLSLDTNEKTTLISDNSDDWKKRSVECEGRDGGKTSEPAPVQCERGFSYENSDNDEGYLCCRQRVAAAGADGEVSVQEDNEKTKTETNKITNSDSTVDEIMQIGILRQLIQPFEKIGRHRIWDLFLTKFLGGCSVLVFRYDVNQRLTDFYGATPSMHGYVTSFGAIAAATFSTFVVERISSAYYSKTNVLLLYHTTLLHIGALLLLALAPNLPVYFVGILMTSYTNASSRVTYTQVTIDRGGGSGSASLIGLCQSVMSVSRILSPIVAGFIQDSFLGLNGPPILAICLAAGSAAAAKVWLIPKEVQQLKREKVD